jgi:hypothetical protein
MVVLLHSLMISTGLHHVVRLGLMIFRWVLGYRWHAVVSLYLIFKNVLLVSLLHHLNGMLLLAIILLVVNRLLPHLIIVVHMMELA